MSPEGVDFYDRLNNLCARAWWRPANILRAHSPPRLIGDRVVCAAFDFPDWHLWQTNHEDVAETLLKKLRDGKFTGRKPAPGDSLKFTPHQSVMGTQSTASCCSRRLCSHIWPEQEQTLKT